MFDPLWRSPLSLHKSNWMGGFHSIVWICLLPSPRPIIIEVSYYSLYNSPLGDTLKNTSCLPFLGFEPGTYSCGTRKDSFCARLRLPLAAPSREYFLFLRIFCGLRNLGFTYCTYNILPWLGSHIQNKYARTGCELICSLAMRADYLNL